MKSNKSAYFLVPLIALAMLLASAGTCLAQSGSPELEQQYSAKASQLIAQQNYQQAAATLEDLLTLSPEPKNETVYKQLTHIYDNYLFDFDKALSHYQKYLALFPQGKFSQEFRVRAAYLQERRPAWDALRDFRRVQLEEEEQGAAASIEATAAILSRSANSPIAPELHIYLAKKYFDTAQFEEAGQHAAAYIADFDQAGIPDTDRAAALLLYSEILVKQKSFGPALKAINQIMALGNPGQYLDYEAKSASIINQRNSWYWYLASLTVFLVVAMLLLPMRFWRQLHLAKHARQLAMPLTLLALVSLGPLLYLKLTGEPLEDLKFFFGLLALSLFSLLTVRLLTPLSLVTGRLAYVSLSCLHMAAAAYLAFYWIAYAPV